MLAAAADAGGAHALALDALLGAVPFVAVSSLTSFGGYLDARDDSVVALQAFLWAVVLALLVLSCAMRSAAVHAVPPLAVSALFGAVVILAIKGAIAAAPYARRLGASCDPPSPSERVARGAVPLRRSRRG